MISDIIRIVMPVLTLFAGVWAGITIERGNALRREQSRKDTGEKV